MKLAFFAVVMLATCVALVFATAEAVGYEPANPADGPAQELIACQSQVASLEAALYVSERQACPNLGVYPMPAPAKGRP